MQIQIPMSSFSFRIPVVLKKIEMEVVSNPSSSTDESELQKQQQKEPERFVTNINLNIQQSAEFIYELKQQTLELKAKIENSRVESLKMDRHVQCLQYQLEIAQRNLGIIKENQNKIAQKVM
ncbi:Hypothetical_protein [Hexamita inflata]|uniref:Hypothetical_protein n=1 Tax=Hexamita inflata TaxID=28002 RepID=A0AA86QBD4_9EUKA|nr:Hypothetical protein HINF_LOCUS40587 [Hexamita inflata]